MMRTPWVWLVFALMSSGCGNMDPFLEQQDPYVSGMRWFNHKDYKWARKFWEPLAEDGDCDAQYRMGTLYFLGAGVPRDYEMARQWWLKAANQGQSFAQALLATMYARDSMSILTIRTESVIDCTGGCGCDKNMIEAYKWMRLSERFAVYDDTRKAAQVTAMAYQRALTPQEIAEADRFVKEWRPDRDACQPRELY